MKKKGELITIDDDIKEDLDIKEEEVDSNMDEENPFSDCTEES